MEVIYMKVLLITEEFPQCNGIEERPGGAPQGGMVLLKYLKDFVVEMDWRLEMQLNEFGEQMVFA